VFVDAELDWHDWTDQQDNKREAVTLKARKVLFEDRRPQPDSANGHADDRTPSPAPIASQLSAAPVPVPPRRRPTMPAAPAQMSCRTEFGSRHCRTRAAPSSAALGVES
jgi:hypothetical protein